MLFVGVTYPIKSPIKSQILSGGLMVERKQLRLVFSRSLTTPRKPLKASLRSSPARSAKPRDSPLLGKVRHLEGLSPAHARAVEDIVDAIFVEIFGSPLE